MNNESFFHKGYFKEVFRGLRVAGLVSGGILCLMRLIPALSSIGLSSLGSISMPDAGDIAGNYYAFITIMGVVITFMAFGWMNKRSSCDFYHALPIRRTAMYFTSAIAAMVWLAIGVTAASAVNVLSYAIMGLPFNYLLFLCIYINMLISIIAVVGASAIAVSIAGSRFVNIIAALAIIYIPKLLLMVFGYFISVESNGALMPETMLFLFNPSFNILATIPYATIITFISNATQADYANVWAMLYSLIYACGLVVLGWRAFVSRRSEAAGMPVTSKLMQTVIRCAVGMPFLLVLAFCLTRGVTSAGVIFILVLFSFMFYCLYELISTKSAKKMAKSMPWYLVCVAVAVIYIVLPHAIAKAELNRGVTAESMNGFYIVDAGDNSAGGILSELFNVEPQNNYNAILAEDVKITDANGMEIIASACKDACDSLSDDYIESGYSCQIVVRIDMKHGTDVWRKIKLSENSYTKLLMALERNEEYARTKTVMPPANGAYFYVSGLSSDDACEIGKLYISEMNALSDKERYDAIQLGAAEYYIEHDSEAQSLFKIIICGAMGVHNYTCSNSVSPLYTPQTCKRYMEMCNQSYNDAINAIGNGIRLCGGEDENSFFHMDITVHDANSSYGELYGAIYVSAYTSDDNAQSLRLLELLKHGEPTSDPNNYVMLSIRYTTPKNVLNGEKTIYISLSDEDLELLNEYINSINMNGIEYTGW